MEDTVLYEKYVRDRITELRVKREISEHRMSLDLGKSGSYIRGITNGSSLPSLRELFNIMEYFDLTPSEFFSGLENQDSLRTQLREKLLELDQEEMEKVATFLDWIKK